MSDSTPAREFTYDDALRQVLGDCVDNVPNADVAVSSCASLLESVQIGIEMAECLSQPRLDPIEDLCRWQGAKSEINSEMLSALAKLRRVITALRSVCPSEQNQLTH